MGAALVVIAVVVALTVTAAVSTYIYYGRLYMRARVANAEIGFGRMFRMTASGLSAFRVVTAYLNAKQAGYDIPLDRFEAHARNGGDPLAVSRRLESARRAGETKSIDAAFAEGAPNAPHAA